MKKKFKQGEKCFLSNLTLHQTCKVINVLHPNSELRQRLLDMGLTKDAIVSIIKISPLSDPIDIELRNYELCLRRNDLKNIEVEVIK